MNKRICPHCDKPAYSPHFEDQWECPNCGEANEKARPALQCQADHRKINSRVIIPQETDFRPIHLLGFIGSVEEFRQFLKAQFVLLENGILLP